MIVWAGGDVGSSLAQAYLPVFGRLTLPVAAPPPPPPAASSLAPPPPPTLTFDMPAAWPTLKRLLTATLCISTSVVLLASGVLAFGMGALTTDAAVVAEARRVLPLLALVLGFHGSAVTLEGVLLAQRALPDLCLSYTAVTAAFVALQWATRRSGLGLAGVWSAYFFIQVTRVGLFAWRGGVLALWRRRRRAATKVD